MKNVKFKNSMLLISFTILLIFIMINFSTAWDFLSTIMGVLSPFFYGFIIAYILNFPFSFFSNKAYKKIGLKNEKLLGLKKGLALLSTYICAIAVITLVVMIIVPQIVSSVQKLATQLPMYANNFQSVYNDVVTWINDTFNMTISTDFTVTSVIAKISETLQGGNLSDTVSSVWSNVFPIALNTTKYVINGVYTWIIAIIVSIYMLGCKEKLCSQCRRLTKAFAPVKRQAKIFEVIDLSNKVCGNFIMGRVIDSLIMGVLCFIGMSIFRFDYALLISVVICVTNVIPFFGPFIGAIPSAFLMLMISPQQCFWFVVFIVVLQQIDGNFIGPKIIGNTIGISGIWIVFSITVGSGLFGVAGMILGIPAFVVVYTLLGKVVSQRLKLRDLEEPDHIFVRAKVTPQEETNTKVEYSDTQDSK